MLKKAMINKYYSIYYTSIKSIIVFIVLSFFLHIFFIIFIIYNISFSTKTYTNLIKKDRKIITLLPLNYENTEKILPREYSLKTSKIVQYKQTLKSNVYKPNKILENIKETSKFINNDRKLNTNSNLKNTTHILSQANSTTITNTANKISDENPRIIKYFHPKYPNAARLFGIEGELNVMYDINVMGKIENVRILSSVPSGAFEENTKLAMRRWMYEKNKPKKNLTVCFKFSLNSLGNTSN